MSEIAPVSPESPAQKSVEDLRSRAHPNVHTTTTSTTENAHFSRIGEIMAQMSRVAATAPGQLRAEASRMSRELEAEAAQKTGMAAVNLRTLSLQLAVTARTGEWPPK